MGCSSSKNTPNIQEPQREPSENLQNEDNLSRQSTALNQQEGVNETTPEVESDHQVTETDNPTPADNETNEADQAAVSEIVVSTRSDETGDKQDEDAEMFDEEWRKYVRELEQGLLLEKLYRARSRHDRQALEAILPQCVENEELRDHKEVVRAQKMLDRLKARDGLRDAVESRDVDDIETQLQNIKSKGYSRVLQQDVIEANIVLEMLRRELANQEVLIPLDKKTMTEIRRYQAPPAMMHRVIQAALLLLGKDEYTTQEWPACQKLMNPQGNLSLSRKFHSFTIQNVHPEICARVKFILLEEMFDTRTGKPVSLNSNTNNRKRKQEAEVSDEDRKYWRTYDLQTLQKVSPTAVPFYVWSMGVINEYEEEYGEDFEQVKPAGKERQLELLRPVYESYKPPPKPKKHRTSVDTSSPYTSTNYYDYDERENE